jgi:hypothetical protein
VAPNSVVGPSYLSNWVYQFIECITLLTIFSYWYISCNRLNNSHALRKVEFLKGRGWLCFDIIFCVFTPSFQCIPNDVPCPQAFMNFTRCHIDGIIPYPTSLIPFIPSNIPLSRTCPRQSQVP